MEMTGSAGLGNRTGRQRWDRAVPGRRRPGQRQRARIPAGWSAIRAAIFERAAGRCEGNIAEGCHLYMALTMESRGMAILEKAHRCVSFGSRPVLTAPFNAKVKTNHSANESDNRGE